MREAHDRAFAAMNELAPEVLAELDDVINRAMVECWSLDAFRVRFREVVIHASAVAEQDSA